MNAVLDELQKINKQIEETFSQFKKRNDELEEAIKKNQGNESELRNNVNEANKKIEELRKQQEDQIKKYEELELRSQRPTYNGISADEQAHRDEKYQAAFRKLVNRAKITDEERSLLYANNQIDQVRSMGEDISSKGGVLAPAAFEASLIKSAYDSAAIRTVAQVQATSSKQNEIPTIGKVATAWLGEGEEISPQDVETGLKKIKIYKIGALVKVSNELLEDSVVDLFSELSEAFGEAMAEAEDDAFALGNGVKKPGGIFFDAAIQANYIASGVAAALFDSTHNGADALSDAMYKIKATYRKNGTWSFNSITESIIRKLKDSNGQYLWQPSIQIGTPASLYGRPIINPEGAPDIAAGAFPIVFGDFRRGYKIRDRRGVTIKMLGELYSTTDETGFLVTRRTGGEVVQPEAFSSVKIATS